MRSRNVEMMHRVSGGIAVLRDIGRRTHVEREAEAALVRLAPRLHAHFHHALAHCGLVAESGHVPNRVNQERPSCRDGTGPVSLSADTRQAASLREIRLASRGQLRLHRIIEINLMNRSMSLPTFPAH